MVPHNRPTLGSEESSAAASTILSGWVAQGPQVNSFENELCHFLGLPDGHAVAVSSGSAALLLALWVLGAKEERVACPVYACSALSNAIKLAGSTPVFVDLDDGPNVSVGALAKTGAKFGIATHMFGLPLDLSGNHTMKVIEDCAQAVGARYKGKPVGIHGDVGIFSFYATKMLTTGGQGGAVVSTDRTLIDAVRDYRQFDCRKDRHARFNFQMTDPQAAVGRVQLKRLPEFLARRAQLFETYLEAGIELLDTGAEHAQPVRYRAVTRVADPHQMIEQLQHSGISAIIPINDWELLDAPANFPQARALARLTISLPLYPSLSNQEQMQILSAWALSR